MTDQEYLDLFKNTQNTQYENLNETQNSKNEWENLNLKKEQQKWDSLNETPDVQQYKQFENLNSDINIDIQFETRVNGVVSQGQSQQSQNHPYHSKPKRKQPIFNDIPLNSVNEVVKQPYPTEIINESLEDANVVSVEFFNKMGNAAMLELANKKANLLK